MVLIAVLMYLDISLRSLYSPNVIQALLTESTCAQVERHQRLSDSSDSRGVCYADVNVASEGQKDGLVVVRVRVVNVLYDDASRRKGSLIGVGVAGSPAFLHVSLLRLAGDVGVARAIGQPRIGTA
jgi:hypothetical protein